MPLLDKTHDFSDPDTGDSHSQSQWQISKESDFSSLLLDITSGSYLTSLTVPHSILDTIQLPQIGRKLIRSQPLLHQMTQIQMVYLMLKRLTVP